VALNYLILAKLTTGFALSFNEVAILLERDAALIFTGERAVLG
jgi:hypothetical protein